MQKLRDADFLPLFARAWKESKPQPLTATTIRHYESYVNSYFYAIQSFEHRPKVIFFSYLSIAPSFTSLGSLHNMANSKLGGGGKQTSYGFHLATSSQNPDLLSAQLIAFLLTNSSTGAVTSCQFLWKEAPLSQFIKGWPRLGRFAVMSCFFNYSIILFACDHLFITWTYFKVKNFMSKFSAVLLGVHDATQCVCTNVLWWTFEAYSEHLDLYCD